MATPVTQEDAIRDDEGVVHRVVTLSQGDYTTFCMVMDALDVMAVSPQGFMDGARPLQMWPSPNETQHSVTCMICLAGVT